MWMGTTPRTLVRSVSGTWHHLAEPYQLGQRVATACHRLVLVGSVLDWDGERWPGARVCCDCPWQS